MIADRRAAFACVAAGVAWLVLVPASQLFSSDGYHLLMGVALVVLGAAWWLVAQGLRSRGFRARNGFWLVLAGLVLAALGAPFEAGGPFLLGVLVLLVGGPTAAVALRGGTLPFWALALVCLVGFGVLFGDLFMDAPFLAALGGIGLFGAGWIALGWFLRDSPYAFSSTPT